MGKKSKIVPQRIPTKRQLSRGQREARVQRMIIVTGALAILIVLAIPLFGFTREVLLKGRETVAQVNQTSLSLSDYSKVLSLRQYLLDGQIDNLERVISSQPEAGAQLQSSLQRLESVRASLPSQVVQDWIAEQLLLQEAARLGISVTPDEVTAAIKPEFDPLPTAEGEDPQPLSEEDFQRSYKDFLARARTTDALYRQLRAVPMLAEKIEQRLAEDIKSPAPQVQLQGIILTTESDARDAIARLDGGEDFAQVASELSTDPETRENGGDLGWAPQGLLEKDLEDAVFSAKVGQTGGPIESSAGYVVFRVVDRNEAREIEPDTMEQIKARLLDRWLQEAENSNKVERFLTSEHITWAEKQNKSR